jgi:hypothetical protein
MQEVINNNLVFARLMNHQRQWSILVTSKTKKAQELHPLLRK